MTWPTIHGLIEGAFAEVFRAEFKPTGQPFALKTMQKERLVQLEISDQMANEIEIMGLLEHQNIVRMHYYFETKTELILVLEFADQGNLFQKIKERRGSLFQKEGVKKGELHLNDKMIIRVGSNF